MVFQLVSGKIDIEVKEGYFPFICVYSCRFMISIFMVLVSRMAMVDFPVRYPHTSPGFITRVFPMV